MEMLLLLFVFTLGLFVGAAVMWVRTLDPIVAYRLRRWWAELRGKGHG